MNRLPRDRERLLRRRLEEAANLQPEIGELRRLLLNMGGVELVAPPGPDAAVGFLIDYGFAMAGPVKRRGMIEGGCHKNVSRLWVSGARTLIGIGTGYALSGDGLWRQHSWGIRRSGIIETTAEREVYFGIALDGSQADSFAESSLP